MSMGTPWIYSYMYQRFVDTNVPGAAYLLCCGFMMLAQAGTMRLSASEMGDEPEPEPEPEPEAIADAAASAAAAAESDAEGDAVAVAEPEPEAEATAATEAEPEAVAEEPEPEPAAEPAGSVLSKSQMSHD
jgi:hypothetical protein